LDKYDIKKIHKITVTIITSPDSKKPFILILRIKRLKRIKQETAPKKKKLILVPAFSYLYPVTLPNIIVRILKLEI
jgi:hypothetical protein